MDLKSFLKNQIDKGNTEWESRSELLRASKAKISGHSKRILKEYENKFKFGLAIQAKIITKIKITKPRTAERFLENLFQNSFI